MNLIRLGFQLVRSNGRNAALRLSLLALGAAVSCFVVLSVTGMSQLASRQDARDAATAPVYPTGEDAETSIAVPGITPIRFIEMIDGWGSIDLERIVVADVGANPPLPPGVDRLPQPGEVVLSPALQQLAHAEVTVAQRFPQTSIGTIGDDGLAEPDALVAYVGVDSDELPGGFATSQFGTNDPGFSSRDPGANRTVALLLLVFLLVPIAVFLSTCARLSANARDQRLAALRLVGLSARQTQLVNSIEIGTGATIGAIAGAAAFQAVTHTARSAQIGQLSFFVADVRVGALATVTAIVVLAGLAVAVAAGSSQAGISEPVRARREQGVRTVRARRIAPLALGVVLLAVSWQTAGTASIALSRWLIPFFSGLALTALGLALAAPFVSVAASHILSKIDRPAALLASGRLRHDPGAASRLTASLGVSVFALGFGFVVLAVIDSATYGNENVTTDTAGLVLRVPEDTTLDDIQALDGVIDAAAIRSNVSADEGDPTMPARDADVLVATCETARQLSGLTLDDCIEGHTYRLTTIEYAEFDDDFTPSPPAGIPPISGTLGFDFLHPAGDAANFLTPPDDIDTADEYIATVDTATYTNTPNQLVATVAQRFPGGYWILGINDGGTASVFAGVQGIVILGGSSALIIGFLALIIATIDRTIDRRREIARLAAIGTPLATLRRAHILQTLPVTATVMLTAGAASIIGGSSYLRYGGDGITDIPLSAILTTTAIGAAGATLAAALGLIAIGQKDTSQQLRDE